MSYYDNVKDSVREKDESGDNPSFNTLREKAEKSSEEEEEGDDTQIEVLEEGLDHQSPGKTQKERRREQTGSSSQSRSPADSGGGSLAGKQVSGSTSGAEKVGAAGLEDKLDRIIEQNDRMIEILESFSG